MPNAWIQRSFFLCLLGCIHLVASAQRVYTNNSVLSSGNWYKIAVTQPGIYRIDVAFLAKLGISTSGLPSSAIRLYGNGGGMLPEDLKLPVTDDLIENSLHVEDGGDGVFNGNDYLLFYAPGPHHWNYDSATATYHHQFNLYSDRAFYYITTGGTGKRTNLALPQPSFALDITSFSGRYFYENDTFNLLSSGKQWIGDEFSQGPGKTLVRSYPLPAEIQGVNGPVNLKLNVVARAFGSNSTFLASFGSSALEAQVQPVTAGAYDQFARTAFAERQISVSQGTSSLQLSFVPGSSNAQGWLDWFELHYQAPLRYSGRQLNFSPPGTILQSTTARITISDAPADLQVWDVTEVFSPTRLGGVSSPGLFRTNTLIDQKSKFQAFTPGSAYLPEVIGRIPNQNLHRDANVGYIIITHPSLISQANRLAAFHRTQHALEVEVATTEMVFNEFSSGVADPSAIRNYVKMFYDRAGSDSSRQPQYLLLFGDGSFDFKERIQSNTNLVPTYQSENSFDPLASYTSDDFFGFLDDEDDISGSNVPLLDIGIGRLPARNISEAKAIVDKILQYNNAASLGPWRTDVTFVADDEDNNLHLEDAESVAATVASVAPAFNREKVYLDAFEQRATAGGASYPDANLANQNHISAGTLIWNYSGHGGYRRLAEEVILDQTIINSFRNEHKLPLFITATCDVAPFDNPLISSIGENLLLREKTGAIALMTTTRLVFAFSNRVMNNNYMEVACQRRPDGSYRSLGEAARLAKNRTYQFSGDVINNRKFMLLGDPAQTLAFPKEVIRITGIDGVPVSSVPDTLKALSRHKLDGEVRSVAGTLISDFNGTAYVSVFDKEEMVPTKANDPGSLTRNFPVQKNLLFRGKAKVAAGKFTVEFIVPKDINYQFGRGRLSLYAENGNTDAAGSEGNIIVGGTGGDLDDKEGPVLEVFLNDEKFLSGGITNQNPVLLVKLRDSSGINISGAGIGHDLVAIIDNDQSNPIVLNEFYEGDIDDYKKGAVRFQLPALSDGLHTLTVRAWDVANNASDKSIEFRIIKSEDFSIKNVLNYPNPFTSRTNFWFEHNRAGEELRVSVQVYTVSGKLVKTLRNTIITTGNRSFDVEWDGRDEYGSKIGRGVYIYNLKVQTSDGKTAQKLEKLYKL